MWITRHAHHQRALEIVMADLTALNAAVAKLAQDVPALIAANKALQAENAALKASQGTPPAEQAAIDAAASAVAALDTDVVGALPAHAPPSTTAG